MLKDYVELAISTVHGSGSLHFLTARRIVDRHLSNG
jgi:hypothetical protein